MNSEKLQVTLDAGVKRITFNNPARRNAIDFGMFEAFAAAVEESATDDSRVLVITGVGEAFCSGLDLGLVNAVVPLANLDSLVDDLAAGLSAAPQPSLARIKAALNLSEQQALASALDFEAEGQAACFRSPDFVEGVTAFMQKRAPQFGKGRG